MPSIQNFFTHFLSVFDTNLNSYFKANSSQHKLHKPGNPESNAAFFKPNEFVEIYKTSVFKKNDLGIFREAKLIPPVDLLAINSEDGSTFNTADLSKDKIGKAIRQGYSIKINEIQRWSPKLLSFAQLISDNTSLRASFNAYYTPANETCFKAHKDNQWIFIFQISGKKRWYLGTNSEDATKNSTTFILEAGDILFIPKGMSHFAEAVETSSLHITLALVTHRLDDYISHILNLPEITHLAKAELSTNEEARLKHIKTFTNIFTDKLNNVKVISEYCKGVPYLYDDSDDLFKF